MDYPMYKVIKEEIEERMKEINGLGTTITLSPKSGRSYAISYFAILVGYASNLDEPVLSCLKIQESPAYSNIHGAMVSSIQNTSEKIIINLSATYRVAGFIINDNITDTVTIS